MARKVNPEEVVVFLDEEKPPEELPVPSTGYTFSQQGPYLETPAGELLSPVTKEPLGPEALGWVLGVLPDATETNKSLAAARALGLEEYYERMPEGDRQLLESMWAMSPVKREETANQFRFVYDRKKPVTTASATARTQSDFLKRAEERGIDVREVRDPGFLSAAKTALPTLVPFYDELRGRNVDVGLLRQAAVGIKPEDTGYVEKPFFGGYDYSSAQDDLALLQETSPELFNRLKAGDENVTSEEVQAAVTQGLRQKQRIAELYQPAATLGTEAVGTIGRDLGLSKALGRAATRPAFIAGTEAVYGAGRGETLPQRLGGAVLGGLGGYAAGKLGEPLGRKAADLGVGKAPLKGGLDVVAARRAQSKIDELLAPVGKESFAEYAAGQTRAERDLLAKAIKELRAKAKQANKAYQNMTTASQKYTVDMAKHEEAIRKAAEDAAAGKLGFADAEKIIAKEKEAALQLARRMSSGKTEKGLLSDYEKATLGLTEANASLEKTLRSQAGLVGAKSRSQLEAFSNALPQLKQQIAEDVLTPEEQLTYSRLNLRRGELGREALQMSPQKEAAYEMAPVIEAKKQEVDFWKKKVEEAAAPAGEKALPPSADPELYQKILQQRLAERKATGFLPESPGIVEEEARRLMSLERPSLVERYGLGPEELRLRMEKEKLAPLTPSTLSREQLVEQAESVVKKPEYREALLAEMPAQRAALETPYTPPTEAELAEKLYKGVTVPEVERARGGMSVGLPGLPARGYIAETKPPLSSVDISPYTKYTKATQARDVAQEAMATPVAVPVAQSLTRLGVREGVPAATESFIDYLKNRQVEDEAAKQEEDAVSKKLRQYLEVLQPAL